MAAVRGAATARRGGFVAVAVAVAVIATAGSADSPRAPGDRSAEATAADAAAEASTAEALRPLAERVRKTAAAAPSAMGGPPDPAAPLPGAEWIDPDSVNWADAPDGLRGPARERLLDRRGDRGPLPGGRLLERLRGELRASAGGPRADATADPAAAAGWPEPARLCDQLGRLAAAPAAVASWATTTLAHLRSVRDTSGPADPAAAAALLPLGDDVDAGMALADRQADPALGSAVRRAALAVARRVAVWRAASAAANAAQDSAGAAGGPATDRLLAALERFESASTAAAAADVHTAVERLGPPAAPAVAEVVRAVGDHYLAPNLRVAVHRSLIERLLPEATVTNGPLQDYVLGRAVRGTRRVEQSTGVRFVPDPDEIRVELLVDGVVSSRSVAESGPVAIHTNATAEFTVRKPLTLSRRGLAFGHAVGTASNQAQLADIRTEFDALPIMGPLVRSIARNQHDEQRDEATREVNDKIITRACREVDRNTEPRFRELAERVRSRVWEPLTTLGLEPRALGLETAADLASARIRLAGAGQLAAHTPRPRGPDDALVSVQVHESAVNNACERLELAGRRLTVEALVRTICGRLGVPPRIPDDLPTDVEVAFAAEEPLRVECRDGLVHLRMALDAIESDRRSWYDIVAHVTYRPVVAGPQILLEREGPVRLAGAGQQGRVELALRTVFGKLFPKERPVPLVPAQLIADPRLAGVQAVQAVSIDGWLAIALAAPPPTAGPATPTAARPQPPARRLNRR